MRIFAGPALLALSTLALPIAQAELTPAQAQSTPVQAEQTPAQSDQSRDRSRAENVKIGRDWKARGGSDHHSRRADTDKDHQTVGRDWRVHPDNRGR